MYIRVKVLAPLLCCAAFTSAGWADTVSSTKVPLSKVPLRVALIGGLTGPVAPYGLAAKNGLLMAIEKESASSLVEVLLEDDGFVPSRTVSAYRKLLTSGSLDVVMTTGSTPSLALAPIAAKDQVPFIACASDERVSRGFPNALRNWVSGRTEGELMARVAKERGLKSLAIVSAIDDYSQSVIAGFSPSVDAQHILDSEEVPQDLRDFRPLLVRAKQKHVDAFVLCLSAGQPGLFALQAKQLGLTPTVVSCITAESRSERDQSQGALDGTLYVTVPVQDWFRRDYQDRFGDDTVVAIAAAYFDVGTLLVRLARDGVRREKVLAALDALPPQEGALGRYAVVTDREGRHLKFDLVVKKVE